jgi:hypothetical protein
MWFFQGATMNNPDHESTVDCGVNSCEGQWHIMLDGTAICDTCGHTELQWTKPRPDEPIDNATEFQGYAEGVMEYIHCDFKEWYDDYITLLDMYYKRTRGWPSGEAKQKFRDLYMLTPLKVVQLMEKRAENLEKQLKEKRRQAKQDIADKINQSRTV